MSGRDTLVVGRTATRRPPWSPAVRLLAAWCLALACAASVQGAEPAPGATAAAAAARRTAAETRLAEARARLIEERVALATAIRAAHVKAEALRTRLGEAQRGRDAAAADLKQRTRDHQQALLQVRQLADRAVVAAHLPADQARAVARLAPGERVAAAATGIAARLQALPGLLGARLAPETVIARGGALREVPVLRLGRARAIALGGDGDTRGVLALAADGASWLVAGPALPVLAGETGGLAQLAMIPLDPDDTLPRQQAKPQRTLAEWVAGGRFFIWPIIGAFLIGAGIAIERTLALLRLRADPRRIVEVARLLHQRRTDQAIALVAGLRTPLDRILATGLAALGHPREAREAALDQALLAEAPRLQRGLAFILVMAGIAPLLGLLGTVTGMIDMFGVIADQGSGNAKSLSGAISEALIATQAGMIVAIPLLLVHAALARLVERRLMVLEEAACSLLGVNGQPDQVAHGRGESTSPAPAAGLVADAP